MEYLLSAAILNKVFPCGSAGKESACNAGDLGLIPGLGRSPGEGKGYLLQYSGLENSMDYTVHGVAKSWTWLFTNKGPSLVKAMVYPIVMYGYESWTIEKAECWIIDAFKMWCWIRRLKSLGLQGDPTINPKGNQSWIFIGRTDDEAETPILWPPDVKNQLIGKDPDAGRDWRREEKGTTEDEMVGWQHWRDGHEFEQAPGAGEWQGGLVCCSPWGHRVRDDWATELNWF